MAINIETVNQVIYDYISDVKKVFPIDKSYLYGSYAKGTANEDSDIDICFFSSSFNGKKSVDISFELLRLARKYSDYDIEPRGFPTSAIDEENPFIKEILRTGREYIL